MLSEKTKNREVQPTGHGRNIPESDCEYQQPGGDRCVLIKRLPGVTLHKQEENIEDHMGRGRSHT